jgi:hypothetical protein
VYYRQSKTEKLSETADTSFNFVLKFNIVGFYLLILLEKIKK